MWTVKEYVMPKSIEEACNALNERKGNCILGGGIWTQMSGRHICKAIDLSKLQLNYIDELEDSVRIGSNCTLRELETNRMISEIYGEYFQNCFKGIAGVQFRNMVTVGGSICGCYGFSDITASFLCLDAKLSFYKHGITALSFFINNKQSFKKDILLYAELPKKRNIAQYASFRANFNDIPIINTAVSVDRGQYRIVIGARPGIAQLAEKASLAAGEGVLPETAAMEAVEEMTFGSNMRGSKEYRKSLAEMLICDCIRKIAVDERVL